MFLLLLLVLVLPGAGAGVAEPPQQLHVAFGADDHSMVVCWATRGAASAGDQVVRWGRKSEDSEKWTEVAAATTTAGANDYFKHRAILRGLRAHTEYGYTVGDAGNAAATVTSFFKSQRNATDGAWQPRIAFFGDLGWTNDQILPLLKSEAAEGDVDGIVLFGDMIYWAGSEAEAEASFMRDVSAMSGHGSVPFHVTPGNGDSGGNFSMYRENFAMPGWEDGSSDSLWHSFNMGRAHIVGISTEAFHYQGNVTQDKMMQWLRQDLEQANRDRALRPWIIVHYHRPCYSTNYGAGFADEFSSLVFEPVMYEFGVDLIFAGHVHNQERTWPVYNLTVRNGSTERPYHNGRGPVHMVSGNPSNAEGTSVFKVGVPHWTASRSYAFGYCHVNVINETHLYVDVVSTNLGAEGQVVDDVWITKDKTCSFGEMCDAMDAVLSEQPDAPANTVPLRHRHLNRPQHRVVPPHQPPTPADQLDELWLLYDTLGGLGWKRSGGWRRGGDPCLDVVPWYGVSCQPVTDQTMPGLYDMSVGGISSIQLPQNDLRGDVTNIMLDSMLNANLQFLDLSDNYLFGQLPETIFVRGGAKIHSVHLDSPTDALNITAATGAATVTAAGNAAERAAAAKRAFKLTGTLPESIGFALPNLKKLSLQRQWLTGTIPNSFGALDCSVSYTETNKQSCLFWLENNFFTGAPSMNTCNLTLDEFYLSGNNFECGTMPCFHCSYCSNGTNQVSPCTKPCQLCPDPARCPGGTLAACMALCPSNPPAAFADCVKECATRCDPPGGVVTPL
jgi:hypothetical protein